MNSELSLSGNGGDLEFRAGPVQYVSGPRWELNVSASGDHNYIATTVYMDEAIRLRDWLTRTIALSAPGVYEVPLKPSPCPDCRATGRTTAAKGGDGGMCSRCNGSRYIWMTSAQSSTP
jgi:hypothetical protein